MKLDVNVYIDDNTLEVAVDQLEAAMAAVWRRYSADP